MSTTTTPGSSPFGVGPAFQIEVRRDVKTRAGNVILPAGVYTAWDEDPAYTSDLTAGSVSVWANGQHYAGCDWVCLPPRRFRRIK
jgi:hypothetical protein